MSDRDKREKPGYRQILFQLANWLRNGMEIVVRVFPVNNVSEELTTPDFKFSSREVIRPG